MEDPFCAISSKEEDVRTLRLIAALLKRSGRCFDGVEHEDSVCSTRPIAKQTAMNLRSDANGCKLFDLDEDALREVFAHVLKTDAPYSLMALASSCRKLHHMFSQSAYANSTMIRSMARTYRRHANPVDVLNETLELWQACQLRHACKILHAPLQYMDVASVNELDIDLYESNYARQDEDKLFSWHQKLLQDVPKFDQGRVSVSSLKSICTHYADSSGYSKKLHSSLSKTRSKLKKGVSAPIKYVTTAMACNCHKTYYAIVFPHEVEVYEFSHSKNSPPSNRTNHCPWTFSWSHVFGRHVQNELDRANRVWKECHCYISGDGSLILLGPFSISTNASTEISEWIMISQTGEETAISCFDDQVDHSSLSFNAHPWFLTDGTFGQSPIAICRNVFSDDKTTLEVRMDAIQERSTKFVSQTISMSHVEIEDCVRVAISSSGNVFAVLKTAEEGFGNITAVFVREDGTHSYHSSDFRMPFFTCDGFSEDLHLCVSPNGRVLALSAEHDSNALFLMTFNLKFPNEDGLVRTISPRCHTVVMSDRCDLMSNSNWSELMEWTRRPFVRCVEVSQDLMMGLSRPDSQGFVDRFLSFSGEWFYAPILNSNATLLIHVDLLRGPYVLNNFTPCDACMGQRFAAFEANDADTANCFILYNNADPNVLVNDCN